MEPGHSFDTKGFVFVCKCILLLAVAAVSVRAGSQVVFASLFRADDTRLLTDSDNRFKEVRRARLVRRDAEDARALQKLRENRILESRTIEGRRVAGLIPEKGKFIGADLVAMRLSLYQDGEVVESLDILSKGKPGTYWETPTGLYEVMTKETSHFSSIGDVFMPYSMQFFGNFYIHGWPYYADGSAVRPGFSGGCVRLSTADAKKVFAFADTGVPLFVYTEPVLPPVSAVDGFPVRIRNVTLPKVSARAFIVADVRTGDVYGERAADGVFPIASITKVMTAIVANDSISFDRLISVASTSDQGEGDYGSIGKGGTFSIRDLLYPLLLESNNAVAHSIAASYGNRLFIQAMNAKAQALGAHHTMFTDASGISADNRSTATDLFRIAQYVMQNRSFILETTRLPEKKVTARSGKTYLFRNFNHFFADAAFVGGKTGHTTAAKDTMLSLFNEQVGGATTTIAVVVLGSDDRVADTKLLRSWFEQAAVRAAAVESQPVSVSGTGRSVEL